MSKVMDKSSNENVQAGRLPAHELIYRQLRDLVLFGDLAPGQAVTIQGLSDPLGTGMTPVREAMKLANGHLDYIDYLIDHRAWLSGAVMSMADLAAAAQISVADYLGGIDWTGHEQTKAWYAMFKSLPSFRPLLSERMEVITPPKHYEQVDF